MIDFIPLESYYPLYINFCLCLVIFTLFHTRVLQINDPKNIRFIKVVGIVLMVFSIFYIGLRPVNIIFGDTVNYNVTFHKYKLGTPIGEVGDYGWHLFMKTIASVTNIHVFFTIVCFIYIIPMYRISKVYFGNFWYYSFLMFIVSFSFWPYGVNGIRNGAACSLFLLGLSYRDKKFLMGLSFLLAISFHRTVMLPILAYLLTLLYNNPRSFLKGWFLSIPLSIVAGGFWISLFVSLGFGDDRLSDYLTSSSSNSPGFRWDFLFHSFFAIFSGYYFVIKRKFKDPIYFQLLNTYLICNAFWVLVINASYSNRFAYLSWFMMGIVIIYPLLKQKFFKNQHAVIGNVLSAYFGFTYIMFYVYYN